MIILYGPMFQHLQGCQQRRPLMSKSADGSQWFRDYMLANEFQYYIKYDVIILLFYCISFEN